MQCVSCGLAIDGDPTYGAYAWEEFDHPVEAMELHQACFDAGEFIEAAWWEPNPDPPYDAILRTETQRRLFQVSGPGYWIRVVDPETGESSMIPAPMSAMMAAGLSG